jgi:hypothetical protein
MDNLAEVLGRQGKYAEAEAMNRQTLEIREEVLGKTPRTRSRASIVLPIFFRIDTSIRTHQYFTKGHAMAISHH